MNSHTQVNVNLGLHPNINSSNRSTLRRLSLLLISALVITVGCTPPCRFDEESNCVPGEEMLAGTEVSGEINGDGSGGISGEINGDGSGGRAGEGEITIIPGDHLEAKVIDVLIVASFDQSLIGEYYGGILDSIIDQLARYQITVAHAAIAPMYRRLNTDTPLLYGTPDEESEFNNYNEAFAYFSSEEGLLSLDNQSDLDGQNLLQVGARLGTSAVYHPRLGSEGSRYLYRAAQEGMLVVWINPFARRCQLNDCIGPEGDLGSKLTAANERGEAEWLSLGGQERLPLNKIVHAFIGTEETNNEDDFFNRCSNRVGLPARILDHIEPSAIDLYKQLNNRLGDANLSSYRVDFCQAVSDEGFDALETVAAKMRQQIQ